MTTAAEPATDARGRPCPGDLAEVVDIILDKGLVIDAYVRVSLLGLELLTIDARVVVASIDTYLRFAEAVNRLDLSSSRDGPPELAADTGPGRGETKTRQAAQAAREDEDAPAQQHRQQQTKE